jgi:hypothetical protein
MRVTTEQFASQLMRALFCVACWMTLIVPRVRTEELLEHRVQAILEPRLVLRPLQVATGFVNDKRRIPGDVRVDHCLQHPA